MNTLRLTVLFLTVLLFASCSTTKFLTSGVNPAEIRDLQKFETISYMSLIEKGSMSKQNDSVSNVSKAILDETLSSFEDKIPLSGNIKADNPGLQKKVRNEIETLILTADKQKQVDGLKLTPAIDSLLELNGKRFGLLTVTSGFTREKGNYGKQVAKGAAMGILTLGMVYQTPIKSNSTIYAMIVDAKDNSVVFYRKSMVEGEPLNKDVLSKQINKLFEGYFWTKQ
jgi:hypothetical protein